MLTLSKETSIRIFNLNFICTLLILLMHLQHAGAECKFMSHVFLGITFYDITYLAVPTFFIISGFLLARHGEEKGWYVTALRKRFYTLVIPYFLLNLLYLPMLVIYHNYLGLGEWKAGGVAFDWYSISRIFGLSWRFHPAAGTLWFVRCLLFFIMLSPILVWVIRKSRSAAVVLMGILLCVVLGVESLQLGKDVGNALYSFFNLRGLFFFAGGIVLAYWGCHLSYKVKIVSVLIALVLGVSLSAVDPLPSIGRGSIFVWMLFIYVLWNIVPAVGLPRWLTASSFALFALHPMIYKMHFVVVNRLGLQDVLPDFLICLEALALTMGLVCFLTLVIRRYCPILGQALFGGRG